MVDTCALEINKLLLLPNLSKLERALRLLLVITDYYTSLDADWNFTFLCMRYFVCT